MGPTHIIPCSNILAALRNCARDDIWGPPRGELCLRTRSQSLFPIRSRMLYLKLYLASYPVRQRDDSFVAPGNLLDCDLFPSSKPPVRSSPISFHAQFRSERSEARMFEHGMIYGRRPPSSGLSPSGYARVFRPSRSGRRLVCVFGVCLRVPWWRWRCLRLRGGGVVLRR